MLFQYYYNNNKMNKQNKLNDRMSKWIENEETIETFFDIYG
jgi:hypothetical protein